MNIEKLENPKRISELDPENTLKKIGFSEDDFLCDIGAGTGIFSLPAAKITKKNVYALDINEEFLKIIEKKASDEKTENLKTVKVSGYPYDLDNSSVSPVLLVTVFHEIDEKEILIREIKRILKPLGKIAVIEFHKKETPMGPPLNHRIGQKEVVNSFRTEGFRQISSFDLGENFYCLVFEYTE